METYMIGNIHKIEVSHVNNGLSVAFYELMGGRWVAMGEPETWASMDEIRALYGI